MDHNIDDLPQALADAHQRVLDSIFALSEPGPLVAFPADVSEFLSPEEAEQSMLSAVQCWNQVALALDEAKHWRQLQRTRHKALLDTIEQRRKDRP